jgi:hypothetical protein
VPDRVLLVEPDDIDDDDDDDADELELDEEEALLSWVRPNLLRIPDMLRE